MRTEHDIQSDTKTMKGEALVVEEAEITSEQKKRLKELVSDIVNYNNTPQQHTTAYFKRALTR